VNTNVPACRSSCEHGCRFSSDKRVPVKADLALTGGVHSATDVVKAMMAGAPHRHDDLGPIEARHQLSGHDYDRTPHLDGRA
jgi:hypothetical protein